MIVSNKTVINDELNKKDIQLNKMSLGEWPLRWKKKIHYFGISELWDQKCMETQYGQ